jgi:PAS domain S-box-containing protein/putative nucleotidyltransferase with HDIG domain
MGKMKNNLTAFYWRLIMGGKEHLVENTTQRIDKNSSITIQKIVDSLPFYVILVDPDHKILIANKAVKSTLGIDPEKIIGGFCPRVIHNSECAIPECPLEEAVEKGKGIEREYYDTSYGKWFSSAIYPTELKTLDGKIAYFHMVRDITDRIEAERNMEESLLKLQKITDAIIKTLTRIIDKRDPYTAGHQQRVSKLAVEMAKELQLCPNKIKGIQVASLIHDIGKIAVPIEILSKPGKISSHEFNIIKEHPFVGYEILKEIDFPWPVSQIVLQHHERINGSGYPYGLQENEIILEAKILSVADVVEAMSSHRPYRQALGKDKALEELKANKGILYDKDAVDACLNVFSRGFEL